MAKRPLLLDLFCGGGGVAMGYHRAGFDIVGVDIVPQPLYPFDFICADALQLLACLAGGGKIVTGSLFTERPFYELADFDALHLSPPCQAYCALKHQTTKKHPELVDPARDLAEKSGLPYVIENVPGAPLRSPTILCGTMFGLRTDCGAELRRHRLFETNWPVTLDLKCRHHANGDQAISVTGQGNAVGGTVDRARTIHVVGHEAPSTKKYGSGRRVISVVGHSAPTMSHRTISVHGTHPRDETVRWRERVITVHGKSAESSATGQRHNRENRAAVITVTGNTAQQNVERNVRREVFSVEDAQTAMGIWWLPMTGLSQAIPPAYTEYIGKQLLEEARRRREEGAPI